jgi:predicted nucleotidyltransferase
MSNIIDTYRDQLKSLCERYDVKVMYVFGSATRKDFSDSSDVDILISFNDISFEKYTDNYFELHQNLEAFFQRKVDLLTERSLINPYFIESIEKTKQLLYAA